MKFSKILLAALFCLACQKVGYAQTLFTDATDNAIGMPRHGIIAIADINNDGVDDLVVSAQISGTDSSETQLWKRQTGLNYTNVTDGSGLQGLEAASAGDFNNDGFIDFLHINGNRTEAALYRNLGNGTFTKVALPQTESTALFGTQDGPRAVDIDGDGDLDLVFGKAAGSGGSIVAVLNQSRNGGSTTQPFSGVTTLAVTSWIHNKADVTDANGDGKPDLLSIRTAGDWPYGTHPDFPVTLFLNTGNSTADYLNPNATMSLAGFTQRDNCGISAANVMSPLASWDIDNDGDLDLINGSSDWPSVSRPHIYINDGSGNYTQSNSPVYQSTNYYHHGISIFDADLDNDMDAVWTGLHNFSNMYPRMWRNEGNSAFSDVTTAWGINVSIGSGNLGMGGYHADLDGDGDIDFVVDLGNGWGTERIFRIFKNNAVESGANWLGIKLNSSASAPNGIGARVVVTANGKKLAQYMADTTGGVRNMGSLRFGLGSATKADSVKVYWPSGKITEIQNPQKNQIITMSEETSASNFPYRLIGIHGNQLVEIDTSDGHITFLMSLPFSAGEGVGFDYNPVDKALYAGDSNLYKIDLANRTVTLARTIISHSGTMGFTDSGDIYLYRESAAFNTGTLFFYNWNNANSTSLGTSGTPSILGGDYDSARKVVWVGDEWNGRVYQLNPANASVVWTSSSTWYSGNGNGDLSDMDVTPDGEVLASGTEGNSTCILKVDPQTGSLNRWLTIPNVGRMKIASMPVSAVSTLASLALNSGTLNQVFATGTTSYTASVTNATASVTLTPTVTDSTATVKVNGVTVVSGAASASLPLVVGSNTLTTVVTAQDGTTTSTYTVMVTRAPSAVSTLTSIVPSSGNLSPVFATGTTSYTANVPNTTASVTLTPTVTDSTATVKVNGVTVASGAASAALPLVVGSNTLTTVVTAQNGTTTSTYTVTVTRVTPNIACSWSGGALTSGQSMAVDFGTAPSDVTFTVANTGTAALSLTTVTVSPAANFQVTSQPASTVGINGSTTFTVRALDANRGNQSATVTVASDAYNTPSFTIPVTSRALLAVAGTGAVVGSLVNTGTTALWDTASTILADGSTGLAMKTGTTPNSGSSTFGATFDGPGILSWNWKVSAQKDYDWLLCEVNGVEMAGISTKTAAWQSQVLQIPAGSQVRWIYLKDTANSSGTDSGHLADIRFSKFATARSSFATWSAARGGLAPTQVLPRGGMQAMFAWLGGVDPTTGPSAGQYQPSVSGGFYKYRYTVAKAAAGIVQPQISTDLVTWDSRRMKQTLISEDSTSAVIELSVAATGKTFSRLAANVPVYTVPALTGFVYVVAGMLPSSSLLSGQSVAAFYIAKTETTWGKWQSVRMYAAANGYDIGSAGAGNGTDYPVTNVSWCQVVKWCNARSEQDGLTPVYRVNNLVYKTGDSAPTVDAMANGYRLPTEAQWEFAARGGVSTQNYEYSGSNDINAVAWYSSNSGSATHPVGTKLANELGVSDMSGNMREWCESWYPGYVGAYRVVRGGSWDGVASSCRVAVRNGYDPSDSNNSIGFRVVRSSGQ